MSSNLTSQGTKVSDNLLSLQNQVKQYASQGQLEEAVSICKTAMKCQLKFSTRNDPKVATILNILANIYRDQCKYKEAERLLNDALIIRKKTLGNDDPAVADTLDNLAVIYVRQRSFIVAKKLCERALAIREKGKDRVSIANQLDALAFICWNQGKYKEVERHYLRALEIYESALGPDDVNVTQMKNNLASCYLKQGKYKDAEAVYKKMLNEVPKKKGCAAGDDKQPIVEGSKSLNLPKTTPVPAALPPENIITDLQAEVVRKTHQLADTQRVNVALIDDVSEKAGQLFEAEKTIAELKAKLDENSKKLEVAQKSIAEYEAVIAEITQQMVVGDTETIAELKAVIVDKTERLAEAERTIETHGAFCSICLTEVANRMWNRCSHLAACSECVKTLIVKFTEQNRSINGIPCPKCRAHGQPLPVFI